MDYKKIKQAPRCHYLLVWEKGRQIILNCLERVNDSDIVLSLMTKHQYYEFETNFRNASSIYDVSMSIDNYWTWKKKHREEGEPLSCEYDTLEEYYKAYKDFEDAECEAIRKAHPNLFMDLSDFFKQ